MSPARLMPAFAAGTAALLAACAAPPALVQCTEDEQLGIQETLYFGTARPDGEVTRAEWQAFVADVLTPAFPAGLSWWVARGQWQEGAETVRETAYVLQLAQSRMMRSGPAWKRLLRSTSDASSSHPCCA